MSGPDGGRNENDRIEIDPKARVDGAEPLELGTLAPPAAEPIGAPPADNGRLAFGDDEVRLPWLESDGDDRDDIGGYNGGQLLGLLLFGLLAIGLIGGGIWWAMSHRKDDVLVADGSVIAAPQEPYKERPKDAGGKTFAGTGDTSFAVSEGQSRPGRLGQTAPTTPVVQPSAKPAASASAAATVPGVGVQVAAYVSRAAAEAGWTKLSGQYEALSGLNHRVVEGSADIGTVYRLQAVTSDSGSAHALCSKLKSAGVACQVKN